MFYTRRGETAELAGLAEIAELDWLRDNDNLRAKVGRRGGSNVRLGWKPWVAAVLSAVLLELPFPLAGPMPPWRSTFAWIALVPLLWALLSHPCRKDKDAAWMGHSTSSLRRGFLIGYFCGFLWYMGNCYWIRDTMAHYGDMPLFAPTLLLIGFSAVLGLYFGLFGLGLVLLRRATGSVLWALIFAPFLWTGLELAAARITSVPWDQLGYSQVDNALAIALGPWTGAYGVSFVLVMGNAALFGLFVKEKPSRWSRIANILYTVQLWTACLASLAGNVTAWSPAAKYFGFVRENSTSATAVLVQPNLDVGNANNWQGADWDRHIADFTRVAGEDCKTYIAGIPQTGAPNGEIVCPPTPAHPDLVAWPESPAPYFGADARFKQAMQAVATANHAPLIVGGIGMDFSKQDQGPNDGWREYNSAFIIGPDGSLVGRYDKIHLVPFGEYIPFQNLLTFAHKLTGRVGLFDRGTERNAFLLPTQNDGSHRYGVFICYEAVFADEVRQFAQHGAEVFVNISDDGWYGDTSAPWQHLNMVRMRAIENRRWLLRDTNSGVTAAIDPYGRVRQSIPRHVADALPAEFGYRNDLTFYTVHGDVFAWACVLVAIGFLAYGVSRLVNKTAD
jgi:apolipoprotein N-acyltransferase